MVAQVICRAVVVVLGGVLRAIVHRALVVSPWLQGALVLRPLLDPEDEKKKVLASEVGNARGLLTVGFFL